MAEMESLKVTEADEMKGSTSRADERNEQQILLALSDLYFLFLSSLSFFC